jgi:anti-sigma B factor antagonist
MILPFPLMKISTDHLTLVISDIAELTAGTSREVKDRVRLDFHDELENIDFDASQLRFLDSNGLGVLISMQKLAAERDGTFRLLQPSDSVMETLKLVRLDQVFFTTD